MTTPTAPVQLDDKYARQSGRILLSGTQALVRLPLMQRARDAAAGLRTAGYISGYRGSPLGGYDLQLTHERARLAAADIKFDPGVNEDLAATAVWGTQQVTLLPGARVDGVFAIWYGKGPGVDRAGDPIKHGNRMGSSRHGGVLLVFGDDHGGKSSTIAHQSELAVSANGLPVLYPATVQEYLDLGLHGFALSRFSGLWVGFKCVNETVESTASVDLDGGWPQIREPEAVIPPGGVHARHAFDPLGDDSRLQNVKLPLALAYVRHNRLDRVVHASARRQLGIVTAGKSWMDVEEALAAAGLDEPRLQALGVSVYKPAMIWPLEPQGLGDFARGQRELMFVEEKAAFMETQAAAILYGLPDHERPAISGKRSPDGQPLLPSDVPLEPLTLALAIGGRLTALGVADAELARRLRFIRQALDTAQRAPASPLARTPYFCSGCPHNTSTRVPDGSLALAGIGCHTMALFMDRRTLPPTQMGGEGANWCGIAPFTRTPHVFQNLGDGTYFHSGLMAIRAAVTSGVNITYKILLNDAVAMTGGQAVEGGLSATDISRQLRAERVQRIALVSDDIGKYRHAADFAPGVTRHARADLDAVQRELREVPGVSAIIYEQTCAAEKRRRRKRGTYANPARRAFINPAVCEGCGDCSVQSNCVSVEPLETPMGRKRRIDQSSCNKDYSCINGFCPSFVTVSGAEPRRPTAALLPADAFAGLAEPPRSERQQLALLVTGIGGTGVVTIGAVLAMAAHIDGLTVNVFDMTGLAQKGGAVFSHVKFSRGAALLPSPRVGLLNADVVLGGDLVVTAGADALRCVAPGTTRLVVNSHLVPPGSFQLNPDAEFDVERLQANIAAVATPSCVRSLDATGTAVALLGDAVGSNMLLVGFALQSGLLPVSLDAVRAAVRLNGAAVELNLRALDIGRLMAASPARVQELIDGQKGGASKPLAPATLESLRAAREAHLTAYQGARLAARYRALVDRVQAAERTAGGAGALTMAVAKYYSKLLAYKDEYEVARLHAAPEFQEQLRAAFDQGGRVSFHLAPPLLARRDPRTGIPAKKEFGPWLMPVFRWLARARFLRGTPLDPFGYTAERRLERQLIRDYEARIEEVLRGLTAAKLPLAVDLASIPEHIRGFGHVKQRHLEEARRRETALLERWRGGDVNAPPLDRPLAQAAR